MIWSGLTQCAFWQLNGANQVLPEGNSPLPLLVKPHSSPWNYQIPLYEAILWQWVPQTYFRLSKETLPFCLFSKQSVPCAQKPVTPMLVICSGDNLRKQLPVLAFQVIKCRGKQDGLHKFLLDRFMNECVNWFKCWERKRLCIKKAWQLTG